MWSLAAARRQGYVVVDDLFSKAVGYLHQQLASAANDDYETRAVLLHALTESGQQDYAQANRLYRNRQSLNAAGLAYAALVFEGLDRREVATELLEILADRLPAIAAAQTEYGIHAEADVRGVAAVAATRIAARGPIRGNPIGLVDRPSPRVSLVARQSNRTGHDRPRDSSARQAADRGSL